MNALAGSSDRIFRRTFARHDRIHSFALAGSCLEVAINCELLPINRFDLVNDPSLDRKSKLLLEPDHRKTGKRCAQIADRSCQASLDPPQPWPGGGLAGASSSGIEPLPRAFKPASNPEEAGAGFSRYSQINRRNSQELRTIDMSFAVVSPKAIFQEITGRNECEPSCLSTPHRTDPFSMV